MADREWAIVHRTAFTGEHDRATLLSLLARSEVLEPGFDYGNIGYGVASLVMDSAASRSWKDVLDHELFQPLGMTGTSAYRSAFDGQVLALPHGLSLRPSPSRSGATSRSTRTCTRRAG